MLAKRTSAQSGGNGNCAIVPKEPPFFINNQADLFVQIRAALVARRLAAGDGLAPPRSPSKGDVLLLDDPAFE